MTHTMTVPSRLQQPLHVDTDMDYDLDMSKFPGLDDPHQMYQPALLIATSRNNGNFSNCVDRNSSHNIQCLVSTDQYTEPTTNDVLEELLNVIDSCNGELLDRLVDNSIPNQVSKTGDNMCKSALDHYVYKSKPTAVTRNNIVTRNTHIVPRIAHVTRNTQALHKNTCVTSDTHIVPQSSHVTSTSHFVPSNTQMTSTSHIIPQNTPATRTLHVPKNIHVTSTSHVVPRNTLVTSTSHDVPHSDVMTNIPVVVPGDVNIISGSHVVPQTTYMTRNIHLVPQYTGSLQNTNVSTRTNHQTTNSFHPISDRSTMIDYYSGLRHNRPACETMTDTQHYKCSDSSKNGHQRLLPLSEGVRSKRKRSSDTCEFPLLKRQCYRPNTINYYGSGYTTHYPSFHETLSNRGLVV